MDGKLSLRNTGAVHAPLGLHSHCVAVPSGMRLVFVSGQVGVRPDGSIGATLAEQSDQAFHNVLAILAESGLGAADIVKLSTYIVPDDAAGQVTAARLKYLGDHRPASTAVWVKRLVRPEWLVEIDAVAAGSSDVDG